MYFKGQPLNDKDLILLDVPEGQRGDVVVEFLPDKNDLLAPLSGEFNISIAKII
jgi:hypothetical protein